MDPLLQQNPPMNLHPYQDAMPPQEDVDDYLRKKRKAREHKACYPCRQRKVKCDLGRPCQTCRDREHPELCSYHPPNKRQQQQQQQAGDVKPPMPRPEDAQNGVPYIPIGRNELDHLFAKLDGLENSIADLRQQMSRNQGQPTKHHQVPSVPEQVPQYPPTDYQRPRQPQQHQQREPFKPRWPEVTTTTDPSLSEDAPRHTDVHGLHTQDFRGEIVHLGPRSIPATILAMGKGDTERPEIREMLGKSILPMFGLDNESATYPFVDLWGLPHGSVARARELANALPGDQQMASLFRAYRDMGSVIFPAIANVDELENDLNLFMMDRQMRTTPEDGVTEQTIYGKGYRWLAMLFAVLANGAQCSGMQRKERELTSQVYVCCAFECLRFTNFLSQATIESIQAILVIGSVVQNNMNAGTAWTILGLTIRLAQGLGLHRRCPPGIHPEKVIPRSKVWWAIIWQDSLLSITYDRATSPAIMDTSSMPMPQHYDPSVSPYHVVMYKLCKKGMDIVCERSPLVEDPREMHSRIAKHRDEIQTIMRDSAEYLRDSRQCTTLQQTLEHWALYLHSSYILSELGRPAISPRTTDQALRTAFRPLCIDNLINTIEAFLGLNNITPYARQSWVSMHRGLGSALLLGILGEHTRSERARHMLGRFVAVMADVTSNIAPEEISMPVQRGLTALRKLNITETRDATNTTIAMGATFAPAPPTEAPSSGTLDADSVTLLGEDGSLKLNHSSNIFTPGTDVSSGAGSFVGPGAAPAPSSTAGSVIAGDVEEYSPYSVLNTILWGQNGPDFNQADQYLGT